MTMVKTIALAVLLAAGCASAPPRALPAHEDDELGWSRQELIRHERELTGLAAQPRPDCVRAAKLADNICALAERICVLVERSPPPDGPAACTDARARCQAARERVRKGCPR